jgi:Reverse transcriptase (RNA-dependent DNA polymerase)/Endonuclease-reverse transcriptase
MGATGSDGLKVVYFNAESLVNKLPELDILATSEDPPHIILITETWFHKNFSNALFPVYIKDNFVIYRKDRPVRKGGGVVALVHKSIQCSTLDIPELDSIEAIAFEIRADICIKICLVYRPPGSIPNTFRDLNLLIRHFNSLRGSKIYIGDFNFPKVNWEKWINSSPNKAENEIIDSLLNNWAISGFMQFVDKPTHVKGNILDLILTDNIDLVSDISIGCNFSTSTHFVVSCTFWCSRENPPPSHFRGFKLAKYKKLSYILANVDWENAFQLCVSPDSFADTFYSILNPLIEKYVPILSRQRKRNFFSKTIKLAARRKKRAFIKFRKLNSDENRLNLRHASHSLRINVRSQRLASEDRFLSKCTPSQAWSFISKRVNYKPEVPAIVSNDTTVDGDLDKAELFAEYFSSVFAADDGKIPDFKPSRHLSDNGKCFNLLHFANQITPELLYSVLHRLPSKISVGPDGIPALFLKKLAPVLAYPLAKIFRVCFICGGIPNIWLKSFIIPIFKGKGKSSNIANYRPISLLCEISKVFERIILLFFEQCGSSTLIPDEQHGFRKNRSTVSQLVSSYMPIYEAWDKCTNYNLILLDVKKAFDTVSHKKLIFKLRELNFPPAICNWVSVYLEGRSFQVRCGAGLSDTKNIISGVPQGSILGPLLFSLYIVDLPLQAISPVDCGIFADDNKLGAPSTVAGVEALEHSLANLSVWYASWQLELSIEKCSHLTITRDSTAATQTFYLQGVPIPKVTECRDLGIIIDEKMTFKSHINSVAKKAYGKCYQLRKSFPTRDVKFHTRLFVSYVRSAVEYASVIWSPYKLGLIDKIEKIQRKFTKAIVKQTMSYPERLKFLQLETLESRRLVQDLCFLRSVLFARVYAPAVSSRLIPDTLNRTRGHSLRQKLTFRPKSDKMNYSWLNRSVRLWNQLPEEVINCKSHFRCRQLLSQLDLLKIKGASL